jgi:hypothetical protein
MNWSCILRAPRELLALGLAPAFVARAVGANPDLECDRAACINAPTRSGTTNPPAVGCPSVLQVRG